jgi:hypothetical protein
VLVVDYHNKVVEQARPDDTVDLMSDGWLDRLQFDYDQIAMGEFESPQADLNVVYDSCLACIRAAFTSSSVAGRL